MKVTFDEIARMAGVSKATVSRVVNNVPEGVGKATRERVKALLKSLNYDIDVSENARGTVRSHSIGLILPDITNPFFADLAREISRTAMDHNYSVLLGDTGFSVDVESKFLNTFVAKKVDGVILVSAGAECTTEHQMLAKYGIPCVLVDRDLPDMKRAALVASDNMQASYSCCELLIRNGSREIAYITGSLKVSTSLERLEGYKKALLEHSIPYLPDLVRKGNYTTESGYNAVLELERMGIKYSAILAANDMMALGAMRALKELAYRVPEDIEVIGFDNIVFAQYFDPPLTTIQQPTAEMGCKAVNLMIQAIEGELKGKGLVRLRPKLLRRKTTR